MNKAEIIAKIEDLYSRLRETEYSSWYNRSTTTAWKDSSEYKEYCELNIEQNELINALENMFSEDKE